MNQEPRSMNLDPRTRAALLEELARQNRILLTVAAKLAGVIHHLNPVTAGNTAEHVADYCGTLPEVSCILAELHGKKGPTWCGPSKN